MSKQMNITINHLVAHYSSVLIPSIMAKNSQEVKPIPSPWELNIDGAEMEIGQ